MTKLLPLITKKFFFPLCNYGATVEAELKQYLACRIEILMKSNRNR